MLALDVLAGLMLKILIMVAVGYILKKTHIMNDTFQKQLSGLLLKVVLPLNILAAGNTEYSPALSRGLLQTAVISVVYYVLILVVMVLATRHMHMDAKKKSLLVTMTVFANTAFIGFPVIQELYGSEGYMYAVVYNFTFQFFFSIFAVKLMSAGEKMDWKGFFLSPLTIAPVAAILLFLSPFRVPEMLMGGFSQIGSMMVPLSMLIIGGQLANIPFASIWRDKWSWLVAALRLALLPLATLFILKALGVGGVVAAVCVVLTGVSPGSLNVILAEQYEQDVPFATRTVIMSMVLMVASLPLLLLCISKL